MTPCSHYVYSHSWTAVVYSYHLYMNGELSLGAMLSLFLF